MATLAAPAPVTPPPTTTTDHTKSLPLLLALAGLWGSTFFFAKIASHGTSALQVVFIRLIIGAVVLLTIIAVTKQRLPTGWRTWGHISVAAVMATTAPWLLFNIGLEHSSSSLAATVNATVPLWTIIFALAWRTDKKLGWWRAAGLAIGMLGTLLVAAPWNNGDGDTGGIGYFVVGAALFGASFGYTARFLTPLQIAPLTLAASQLSAGTVAAGLLIPVVGWAPMTLSGSVAISLAMLGIFVTGLGYVINMRIVATDGPATASTVTYLIPIVAVMLGAVLLHEAITLLMLVGGGLTLTGALLVRRRPA